MTTKEDPRLREILQEEMIEELDANRSSLRREAKDNIQRLQAENLAEYNRKKKEPRAYRLGDLVAIRRTQCGPGLKLRPKFLGPYKVTKVNKHDQYNVEKKGEQEGPKRSTTAADGMKYWRRTSGPDVESGRPNVGMNTRWQTKKHKQTTTTEK